MLTKINGYEHYPCYIILKYFWLARCTYVDYVKVFIFSIIICFTHLNPKIIVSNRD